MIYTVVWLVLIVLVFWLFMIRPAQRRQAESVALQQSIQVGDEVVLQSGIFGTVTEDTENHLGIEVAPGVTIRVLRGAVASKVHRDGDDESATSEELDPEESADGVRPVSDTGDGDVARGED